jgi:hypothetical protein
MKSAFAAMILAVLAAAQTASAHPGHVHQPGPVHGYSWVDLAVLLIAVAALPAISRFAARLRTRRSGKR